MSNASSGDATSRIGPLANLPVFYKLGGKRVVLVGGGEPALWKAELLSATGARVEVFAEAFADGFHDLAQTPPSGEIVLVPKRWHPDDLKSAALAVGAFSNETEAGAFAAAARAAGVPVNVVDRPAFCDFQFGAIVNRSPLIVGISTDGAAPVFGQAVRSLIEGLLPESFKLWAAAARDLRREGGRFGDTPGEKRRFWQRFAELALRNADRGPRESDFTQLSEYGVETEAHPVIFIEVGQDADDLTLGAVRQLRSADEIFFDVGIPAAILDFARREARRHLLNEGQTDAQSLAHEISRSAANNARVVRLRLRACKSPSIFPEGDILRSAGVAVRIIPTADGHGDNG